MLKRLSVKNIAIIEDLTIDFNGCYKTHYKEE